MTANVIKKIKRNFIIIGAIVAIFILLIWRDIDIFLGFVVGLLVANFNFDLMAKQLYFNPIQGRKSNALFGFVFRYFLYAATLVLLYYKVSLYASYASMVSFFVIRFAIYYTVGKGGDFNDGSTL